MYCGNHSFAWISPEAESYGGVGLGLLLVHGMVTSHDGSVTVNSIRREVQSFEVIFNQ